MKNQEPKKYIAVTKENREFLAKAFGVSKNYVYMCLTYLRNGGKAEKIRFTAIQRGGVSMVASPDVETLHDHDGYMRQYFPNGAMLEAMTHGDGHVSVFRKGEEVRRWEAVTINQLYEIQEYAKAL